MSQHSVIYGFHAVESFINKNAANIESILFAADRNDLRMQRLLDLAGKHHIKVVAVPSQELDDLSDHGQHQGILAKITQATPHPQDFDTFLSQAKSPLFLLILDGVQDPHNLGACLRTANAAGVDAVIAPKDRAVGMTPVVSKVASGATATTPFFQVVNLSRTLKKLQDSGVWLYGMSEHADKLYFEVDLTGSIAIILGAEEKGMRRLTEEACDFLLRIPMAGTVSSLNVSVAAGVCLFEAVRQRHAKK